MTNEALIAVLGGIGGLLTIITGFLLKLHIQRSNCSIGKNCCVFDCVVDDEVEMIKHIREKRVSITDLKNLLQNRNLQELEDLIIEKQVKEENTYDTLKREEINKNIIHEYCDDVSRLNMC